MVVLFAVVVAVLFLGGACNRYHVHVRVVLFSGAVHGSYALLMILGAVVDRSCLHVQVCLVGVQLFPVSGLGTVVLLPYHSFLLFTI